MGGAKHCTPLNSHHAVYRTQICQSTVRRVGVCTFHASVTTHPSIFPSYSVIYDGLPRVIQLEVATRKGSALQTCRDVKQVQPGLSVFEMDRCKTSHGEREHSPAVTSAFEDRKLEVSVRARFMKMACMSGAVRRSECQRQYLRPAGSTKTTSSIFSISLVILHKAHTRLLGSVWNCLTTWKNKYRPRKGDKHRQFDLI